MEGAFTFNNEEDNRNMDLASEDRENNSKAHL